MRSGPPNSVVRTRTGRPASGNAVVIIIAAFIGAVLFTLGAGAVLYLNTQRLTTAAERVQHTQDVLSSLQRASMLAERVAYRTRLYVANHDEDEVNLAQSAANNLVTSSFHIRTLIADNPNQTANAENLATCASRLAAAMKGFTERTALPTAQIQECQKSIALCPIRNSCSSPSAPRIRTTAS